MPKTYQLTKKADADLEGIYLYTIEKFGLAQAETYHAKLKQAFQTIADNPKLGLDVSASFPDCRRHISGSHVVYYREGDVSVVVMRILHQARDPIRAFEDRTQREGSHDDEN